MKNPEVGWVFDSTFSPQGDQVAVFWNGFEPHGRRGLWVLSWPVREARFIAPNLWPVGWSGNADWIYAFEPSTSALVKVSPRTTKIEPVGSFPRGQLRFVRPDPRSAGDCLLAVRGRYGRLDR